MTRKTGTETVTQAIVTLHTKKMRTDDDVNEAKVEKACEEVKRPAKLVPSYSARIFESISSLLNNEYIVVV